MQITPLRVPKNLFLASSTALRHLRDDPARFALLLAQRFPRFVSRGVAGVARFLGPVGVAYSDWMRGQRASAKQRLRTLPPLRTSAAKRWAAALSAAAGEPLPPQALGTSTASRVSLAREQWHRGNISEAVAQLSGSSGAGGRYRAVLEGELQLLQPGMRVGSGEVATHPSSDAGMRVLHLLTNSLPHTQSGYTLRSHAILSAQRDAGIAVEAVTRIGYPVTVGKLFARDIDTVDGIRYHRILPARLAATMPQRLSDYVRALDPLVDEFAPSVIHTTTPFTNAIVARAVADRHGLPWVYEVRGMPEQTWAASHATEDARQAALLSERYLLARARETELAVAADAVFTLSNTMRDDLIARGVAAERIGVVPNAIDERLLSMQAEPADARAGLGLPRAGFWVGAASSLVDYEGHDLVIDAVIALRERGLDVRLLLVGDGVARPELLKRAAALGEFAVLPGRVPAALSKRYVQALDAVVVARRDLAVTQSVQPLKPVEAMALGRPVILSDLPVLAELAGEQRALLVAAESTAAIVEGVARLVSDAQLRTQLADAGRAFAAERTWQANVMTYANIYGSLCRDNGGDPS